MVEYASGKATIMPAPPSTSQVSLPSQNGATEFIIRLLVLGLREREQYADPEIKAVEDHVHRDGKSDQRSPDHWQIRFHGRGLRWCARPIPALFARCRPELCVRPPRSRAVPAFHRCGARTRDLPVRALSAG